MRVTFSDYRWMTNERPAEVITTVVETVFLFYEFS